MVVGSTIQHAAGLPVVRAAASMLHGTNLSLPPAVCVCVCASGRLVLMRTPQIAALPAPTSTLPQQAEKLAALLAPTDLADLSKPVRLPASGT